MRRFMCGAKEDSGGCFFFFFLKGRIVNYLGTDGSQSAIEFDYRLNGIHNEKALIWRETYEKAISITPHAKLGYQPRPADSQAFGWLSISYFLSSSLPSLMTARVNHVERSCLFACFWNLPQLHSWKRDAFVIVNWSPLFMKYNFVFSLYYRHACSNNNRLSSSTPPKIIWQIGSTELSTAPASSRLLQKL